MFTYCPVDVTSHLAVFRRCKCCTSHNNMFYVFFHLKANSASLSTGRFMIFFCWWHTLSAQSCAAIIKLSISPFRSELHNHTRDFICLLLVCQSPVELSMHWVALQFFCLLIFNVGLTLIFIWTAVSCFIYFCFTILPSLCNSIWLSCCHILALIW